MVDDLLMNGSVLADHIDNYFDWVSRSGGRFALLLVRVVVLVVEFLDT